jgi:hypothetical protein
VDKKSSCGSALAGGTSQRVGGATPTGNSFLLARRRPITLAGMNCTGRPLHLMAVLGIGLAVPLALVGADR